MDNINSTYLAIIILAILYSFLLLFAILRYIISFHHFLSV